MVILEILEDYLSERDLSAGYESNLRRTCRMAASFGIKCSGDLNRRAVNQMLKILSTSKTKIFVVNFRREFMTIWRYAYETGITNEAADRIVKVRAIRPPVRAWSHEELGRLLSCAVNDTTPCGGLTNPRISDWLPAWIGIGYDTGIRFNDILHLCAEDVSGNWITTIAQKTGKALTRPVSAGTKSRISKLLANSPDDTLFLHMLTRRRAFMKWRQFLDRHKFKGTSKYLRRSCATMIEQRQAGSAGAYLQHSSPSLVYKHYIDQTLSRQWEGPPALLDN